jgi:acetylglutamate kinase
MVLNGQTNTELVTLLNRSGTNAIGLSGMDASFLKSKLSPDSSVDSPRGEVTSINTELLELFLQRNYVPVVSPVGFLDDGTTVPLEPDQVASELAVAAKASKLVYLVGVPGFTEDDALLGQLTTTILSTKIAAGLFKPSIARKGRCAITALERGVERVHVIDSRTPHSIIAEFFTDQGIGSLVTLG